MTQQLFAIRRKSQPCFVVPAALAALLVLAPAVSASAATPQAKSATKKPDKKSAKANSKKDSGKKDSKKYGKNGKKDRTTTGPSA